MDEEQAVFNQLTLSDFNKWGSKKPSLITP